MDKGHIFRAYDIRGIYKKDLDEDTMKKIGKALATYDNQDVMVAMDMRLSSKALAQALISGLRETGKTTYFAGLLPLSAAMFHAWQSRLTLAYVTASHLPKEWNGVKFFHSNGEGFFDDEIASIRDIFMAESFIEGKGEMVNLKNSEILENYRVYLVSKLRAKNRIIVAIDCGNGSTGVVARKLFTDAGFITEVIYEEPNGNMPNRNIDPHEDRLELLKEKARISMFGIAFDGDGDRLVFVDDLGRKLTTEQISYIILSELLQTVEGPIVANVECTKLIDDIAKKFSREVIKVPVGHTFLVKYVHEKKASFGVEVSGHCALPSLLPFDDAVAISLYAAVVLSGKEERLSDLIDKLPEYPFERVNFRCADERKFLVVDSLKKKLSKRYVNTNIIDGVRVDLDNGWALIRASNTEPKIRLSIEADTEKELKEIKQTFSQVLKKAISDICV